MSLMCKMTNKCSAARGMCIHEKMMVVMMMLALVGAGHFVFHWF